ncbi:hypothetical protein DS745_19920 [Anaerobacillus alkaliphilus]|uniref:Uncharacterized protein n=1 Tax=Anaerobacillus alkaliphilus TaxID=1548597 RepID=A0A4Q0VQ24_9BACI|nr:hypothetical protein [Anaerobacillus alkaliphilus]RXI98586.1 hypothetical protein DS745_19920 [Anaerobacillus alkaliphilus]
MNYVGWLFVLAAYIAVIGIYISFRQMLNVVSSKIQNGEQVDQSGFQKEMGHFFLRVALIETIPIIFIVAGFIQMESVASGSGIYDIILQLGLVLIILFFGIINLFRLRGQIISLPGIDQMSRSFVNTLVFIGLGLITAIPIISIVALSLLTA